MYVRLTTRVAVLAISPILAANALAADSLTHIFVDLVENTCLPAIENAETPDLSALTPYDGDNPDHNFLGPTIGDGFVHDDPRLLIAFGERNGFRGCEVSFASETVPGEGAAITDALELWINDHIDKTAYTLVDNCGFPGFFKLYVVAGTEGRNPRGHFVRILATGMADPDDEEVYGQPRVIVAETPESSAEQCITEDDKPLP